VSNLVIYEHESTQAANSVFYGLVRALKTSGVKCEVHKNTVLGLSGKYKRPDMLIPSAGLVIEIDSRGGMDPQQKLREDSERDAFYSRLGLQVLSISDSEASNEPSRSARIQKIVDLVRHANLTRERRTLIRVNICLGRKSLSTKFPHIADYKTTNGDEVADPASDAKGLKLLKWWGGTKVIIRPKRDKLGAQAS
jgi:very-short-patch-repair endonuclease